MLNKLREALALKLCGHVVKNLFDSAKAWEQKHIEVDKIKTKVFEGQRDFENMKTLWERTDRFKFRDSLSVVDLVREKMRGFDPKLVLDGKLSFNESTGGLDIISDIFSDAKLAGYPTDNDFLADAKKINDNRALSVICDYIKKNQIIFTVSASKNMEQVTFNGGTINGLELVREQVELLNKIFLEKNVAKEEFDTHAAV